jgi:L-cysteine/cystine lyase
MTFDEGRALFPVLEHVAYLNAGTFGPLARPTGEAIADQLRRDLEHGRSGKPYIEQMQAARAKLRGLFAALVGAVPERVALTYSTTDACNIVLAGLGLEPGEEIVTTDAEHFGLAGPVFTSGATVRVVQAQELGPEELLEAIVAEVTPRTRLLAVSHVLWTTGITLDVRALRERTGVPVLVDGAQSAGAIPVDVGELDYYTVSGQKWLCGPGLRPARFTSPTSSRYASRGRVTSRSSRSSRAAGTSPARGRSDSTPVGCRSRHSWDLPPRSASRRSGSSRGSARWPPSVVRHWRVACLS